MELTNIKTIEKILESHGFKFNKALGQNFLINPSVCPRMAIASGADETCGVLEIGPGIGVLTKELCRVSRKVVAVEIDDRLPPVLSETLSEFQNVKIISGDVLKLDLHKLIAEEFPDMPVRVCANLPYYITSPIIMTLLEEKLPIESITVMVQKEAAARMCATPGTRECSALSAAVQYYTEPRREFSVSRGSFMPSPNVDSAVITLTVRKEPPVTAKDEKKYFKTVRGAFSMRRKTVVNCLSREFGKPKEEIAEILSSEGINVNARAEELTLLQFAAISDKL